MSELEGEQSLDELVKRVQELDEIFNDEEIDYQAVSDAFGIDLESLESDMENYVEKLEIQYSLSEEQNQPVSYAYPTDSGFDLYSTEDVELSPFGRELIPTGLFVDIPDNYELQIRSKSGLAIKDGIMVLNSPGTVDEGYTGEIKVIIFNTNNHKVQIKKGQKIAQGVFMPVLCGRWVNFQKVESIRSKDRNNNGFGSTGV